MSAAATSKGMTSYPVYENHAKKDGEWVEKRKQENDSMAEKKSAGGAKETFPIKLHAMLELVDELGLNTIVSWLPHGRAFKVYDKKRFTEEVLPRYFEHQSEFASFQRQLNIYGFLRLTRQGANQKAYYHELFLRGRPEFCPLIPRNRCATHKVRRTYDPTSEPDFNRMSPLPMMTTPRGNAATSIGAAPNQAALPRSVHANQRDQLPTLARTLAAFGPVAAMPGSTDRANGVANLDASAFTSQVAAAASSSTAAGLNPMHSLGLNGGMGMPGMTQSSSFPMSALASMLSRDDILRKAMLTSEMARQQGNTLSVLQQLTAAAAASSGSQQQPPMNGAGLAASAAAGGTNASSLGVGGYDASSSNATLNSRLGLQSLFLHNQASLPNIAALHGLNMPSNGANPLSSSLLTPAGYPAASNGNGSASTMSSVHQNQLEQLLQLRGPAASNGTQAQASAGGASAPNDTSNTSTAAPTVATAAAAATATPSTSNPLVEEILRRLYNGGNPS